MRCNRDRYLNQLIRKQWNQRIKIITGIRRCGKSTLLFDLFKDHLLSEGTPSENIIELALDEYRNAPYRDTDALYRYLQERITDDQQKYYIFLDEIQYAISREELNNKDEPPRLYGVLNEFLRRKNTDVYVTGSNSKMLSKDVMTEFRGRGDVIHIYPLSFREFYQASDMDKRDAYDAYSMYGGMPYLLHLRTDEEKYDYLKSLFEEIYFKDIEERYAITRPDLLEKLTEVICSSVGSLTNVSKLVRTIQSAMNTKTDSVFVSQYLGYLTDSFLFSKAERYDVKGKRYFEYPSKYYCADPGLRNVRLEFHQQEETHIMENILYNELKYRGYSADVGVVELTEKNEVGKRVQKQTEIDFIARKGMNKVYIQSAYRMDDPEKEKTELRSLKAVDDSFRKIVVSKSYGKPWLDDSGILRLNIIDFLLDENALDCPGL